MLPIGQFAVFGVTTDCIMQDEHDPYPLDPEEAHIVLEELVDEFPGIEAAVLSGLTRTEFYVAFDGPLDAIGEYLATRYFQFDKVPRTESMRYSYDGLDAVTQLCGVATGIAELPGHPFYAGLVADGLDRAEDLGCSGPTMRSVFELALRNADEASAIMDDLERSRPVGVHLAALLLRRAVEEFPHRPMRILLVGADEESRRVALDLALCEAGTIQVIDPNLLEAKKLASACLGNALPWAALSTELVVADVVVFADDTCGPVPNEFLQRAARLRGVRELCLFDLRSAGSHDVQEGAGLVVVDRVGLLDTVSAEEAIYNAARHQIAFMVNREADVWGRGHETVVLHESLNDFCLENRQYAMQLRPRLIPGAVVSAADVKHVTLHSFRGLLHDCAAWLWDTDIGQPQQLAMSGRTKN